MALLNKLPTQLPLGVKPACPLRVPSLPRRAPICKAAEEQKQEAPPKQESTPPPPSSSPSSAPSSSGPDGLKVPESMEWAKPALDFLAAEDVKLQDITSKVTDNELYQKYAKDFFEGPVGSQSTGWNKIPETINGRAAMLGFLAAASAEILGGKSVLAQMASGPQAVLVTIGLITVATLIPIVKGTEGNYLRSLYDTYALPEDLFTPKLELVHGRLAMLGLVSLLAIELVKGSALL